jgi:hypothetical protein
LVGNLKWKKPTVETGLSGEEQYDIKMNLKENVRGWVVMCFVALDGHI